MGEQLVAKIPRWKKFVFTLIPLMIFMATLEIILRLTLPMQGGRVICFAPVLVRVYCPNVAGTVKYGVRITINSGAMIDREYPVEKTAGTTRVAVLGDSFTAGEAVEMGQRFHDLWEERIPKRTGARAEFLNFAGGGYSTWRQLQMFHLRTVKYKPDITILNLFWGNDIDDNIDRLRNGNYNPLKDEYPEFSLWNRILVTRKNFNKWLWNRFITYQFIRQRYNILEQKVKGWLRRDRKEYRKRIKEFRKTGVDSESGKIPQGVKLGAMTVDTDSIFDDRFFADSEGMKLTRKLILKLNQEVKAAGGRLAVIHFPAYDQIHDYPAMPLEEFDEFLAANEIPHLNLFPKYAALSQEELLRTTLMKEQGNHHFSPHGHEFYARLTEDFVLGLLQPGKVS